MQEQLKFELYEDEVLQPLKGHELSDLEGYVASLLLHATSEQPIGIADIIRFVQINLRKTISARLVKGTIRTLRKDHLFPILARRASPAGYWWCASADEMESFIESFRAQALDELHTISAMVKHHYPALAGQLTFEVTS